MAGVEMVSAQIDDVHTNAQLFPEGVNGVLHIHRTASQPVNFGNDQMSMPALLKQAQQSCALGPFGERDTAAGVVFQEDGALVHDESVGVGPAQHVGFLRGNGLFL